MTSPSVNRPAGLGLLFVAALVWLVCPGIAHAVVVINPGETSGSLSATDCAQALVSDSGDCTVGCSADCDLGTNRAQARLSLYDPLFQHTKIVTSTVYLDFKIAADSSGAETPLSSTVAFDVEWWGQWEVTGFFPGLNSAEVVKKVWLQDRTAGSSVYSHVLHTQKADGFVGIDLVSAGFGIDSGHVASSVAANLIRGHTYRFAITITATGLTTAAAEFVLGYMSSTSGIWWNDMTVSVGEDLAEQIRELTQRVDKLESQLRSHTHTYLTGKGVGHNNTEAETSPAIIMDDEPVPDSTLDWLPDDTATVRTLPTQSVLLNNYPNPSNPSTTISYTLPEDLFVDIKIYNTLGQLVRTLVREDQSAGEHNVLFDGRNLASGVYYYRLRAGSYVETRKLTILK